MSRCYLQYTFLSRNVMIVILSPAQPDVAGTPALNPEVVPDDRPSTGTHNNLIITILPPSSLPSSSSIFNSMHFRQAMTRSVPSSLGGSFHDLEMPQSDIPHRPNRRNNAARETPLAAQQPYSEFKPRRFAKPFCKFLSNNPTVFHAAAALGAELKEAGYTKLSEREIWSLEKGGKYYVERNGSSLIAFAVGEAYEPGNGAAMIAGHIDALTAKVKPIPTKAVTQGFIQLGVAPYAGALNMTWY